MPRPVKHGKPIILRLPIEDQERLEALEDQTGYPVKSLIGSCVQRALPFVEQEARAKPLPGHQRKPTLQDRVLALIDKLAPVSRRTLERHFDARLRQEASRVISGLISEGKIAPTGMGRRGDPKRLVKSINWGRQVGSTGLVV